MTDNPRGRSQKLLTADEWISAAALLLPSFETVQYFVQGSESAKERKKRLIQTTEAMCTRCVQLGLHYDALRQFVLTLEDDLAAINMPSGAIREVFAAAEKIVLTLARMESLQCPPAPQSTEPISASERPTSTVTPQKRDGGPRRAVDADQRDAAALALAVQWDKERRDWSLADIAAKLGVERSQLTGRNTPGGKFRSPLFKAYWNQRCAEIAARKNAIAERQNSGARDDDTGDDARDEERDESS